MNMDKNKELTALFAAALEYNCDTFHVFFTWSGHCNWLGISLCVGGWKKGDGFTHTDITTLAELDRIKAEHDKLYAPENLAATQEANRLAKIAELQKQIEDLENKDERFLKQAQGRSVRNKMRYS
jgi:hypothetical protein